MNLQFKIYNLQKGLPRNHAPATRTRSIREQVNVVRGQSLFELVVAIAISALIIVALVSLATNSIKNSSFSNNRARAATYAQQATEWLRGQRDSTINGVNGMDILKGYAVSFPAYCLQDLGWAHPAGDTAGCTVKINGTIFYRWVTLSTSLPNGKTVIEADVVVSWTDSQGFHEVTSATNFSDWRQR